ncbi:hypothetical protein Tco_0680350 [Tanacetum coccineum]|uniref:Uncharacterized protein n=1 Tax=Tanacetum coccineum TaxID=301880 RepID=A0ABQ4XL69_9ASTR
MLATQTPSLDHFDVVTRISDAVSTHCMPNLDHLRVELQSCLVSSQIESKSRNDNLNDEIEKVKRESIDIQENSLKRIKILENDFQRCQAQSINFELQLQHEKKQRTMNNL